MTVMDRERAMRLHRPLDEAAMNSRSKALAQLLACGGDARITLDQATGLNRYLSAPYPRDVLAYSSSTISDISPEAFAHLLECWDDVAQQDYGAVLAGLGRRIHAAYCVDESKAQLVFAPSGTDLEYVALAAVQGRDAEQNRAGIHNILLGADETGSGCIHSAHGRYFAQETALGASCVPGDCVAGFGPVTMVDVPVRCEGGKARSSAEVCVDLAAQVQTAIGRGSHALVHGVHGSKTGLVLPSLEDIDALQARFGPSITMVIDACQARITNAAIAAYLDRGAIVLMTGSKFIGAPPFNGWALIPSAICKSAGSLPQGFAQIFRRAEWPEGWEGRADLQDSANFALALRLEAAVFELERFQTITMGRVEAIIDAFSAAVDTHLVNALGIKRVLPSQANRQTACPIEMRTLITLDMTALDGLESFEDAQALHRQLALDGIRLGQPVKCVRTPSGWGATLRVGLSMPQISHWARLSDAQLQAELTRDMESLVRAISDTSRPT